MSPSGWSHRAAVAVLAAGGCAIAAYLSLFQIHLIAHVVDPVFGSASSEAVLTSSLSRALPVPDATLGAVGYVLEIILALAGGTDRWRTRRGLVLASGLVLAGLALGGLGLLLVQLLIVHAVCALCVTSAVVSLSTAAIGGHEVVMSWSPSVVRTLDPTGEPTR